MSRAETALVIVLAIVLLGAAIWVGASALPSVDWARVPAGVWSAALKNW